MLGPRSVRPAIARVPALGRIPFGARTVTARAPPGPALGAHGSDFDLQGSGTSPQTVSLDTQAAGSSLLVVLFGWPQEMGAPTDNKGNSFSFLGFQGYFGGAWLPFGMEAYVKEGAAGGASHTVSVDMGAYDLGEQTLIVVEAKGASKLQDFSLVARDGAGDGVPYASGSVTTTGPALLVSVWGGDGGTGIPSQDANPDAAWTKLGGYNLPYTAYIQAHYAARIVSGAGTYACDWAPVSSQGAAIGTFAFQA